MKEDDEQGVKSDVTDNQVKSIPKIPKINIGKISE
jgi:hypothetical protein